MINTRKLVHMARKWQKLAALGRRRIMPRKWQKLAALGRRRIMPTRADVAVASETSSTSSVASRGHVFVYTIDGKRFMVPLTYLNNSIFRELFKMAEEEFGLPSNGPITLPCDAASMEYIISLLQSQKVSRDVERARCGCFHCQIKSRCTTSSLLDPQGLDQQQLFLYGF